jgi:hypothetical protein
VTKGKSGLPGANAFPIGAMTFSWLMSYSSSVAGRFGPQNLNLTCSSDLGLSADSENPVPRSDTAPYGWFAWPNRGDLTFPKIGPQLENLFIDAYLGSSQTIASVRTPGSWLASNLAA